MSESTSDPSTQSAEASPVEAPRTVTTLGRGWILKTALFLALLLGFGIAGLLDALYFYPRRGEMYSAQMLTEHLEAAKAVNRLTSNDLKVADPRAALADLKNQAESLTKRSTSSNAAEANDAAFHLTRLRWLESLALMWRLNADPRPVDQEKGPPAVKIYFDPKEGQGFSVPSGGGDRSPLAPQKLYDALIARKARTANVTPLSGLDMLFQWVFVVLGFGGGGYMLINLVRTLSKKYRWEPELQRLTLHDGRQIRPDDVKDFDRSLWHKFFMLVHLNDGVVYKLDLYKYHPLEDWVVEMEHTRFPDRARDDADETGDQNQAAANPNT